MSKYGKQNLDWFEAVVNKLGGIEGAESFLRGEVVLSKPISRWQEENCVITFTLPPTDGTTGEQWITRTESKGNRVGDYAKQLLLSKGFKPTTGVIYTVKVLKGELFSDSDRITSKIRAEAKKRKLQTPNAEMACLIRENFSDEELKEMGLWWIVVMHEPIKDSDGVLKLLLTYRLGGGQWLDSCDGDPGNVWARVNGFAFAQGPQA
jgi:hypothetical protein